MTFLATYSSSLSVGPCEIPSMNLAITSNSGSRQSDLPTPTSLVSLLEQNTTRKGRVYKHYKHYVQNIQNLTFRGAATQSYPAIRKVKRQVI